MVEACMHIIIMILRMRAKNRNFKSCVKSCSVAFKVHPIFICALADLLQ